jgi:iron(III) transport system substrate-binding protein
MKSHVISWFNLFMLIGTLAQAEPPQSVIDAAKREGKLTNWGGFSNSDFREYEKRFNKRYPFIKMANWASSTDTTRERIWSDFYAKRDSWDVAIGGNRGMIDDWIKGRVVRQWSVPSLARIHKTAKDSQGYWAIPHAAVVVPGAYNTTLVSAKDAPKSYEDFLDPKRRGKFAITVKVSNYVSLAQPDSWGKEKVKAYITRLAANKPQITKGRTQMVALLAAGEFPVATSNVALHTVKRLQEKGAPIEWVRAGPLVFAGAAAVMSARAAHPNAAYLWLDWLLSPEGSKASEEIEDKGNPFPGSGSQQSEAIKGLPFVVTDESFHMENEAFTKELNNLLGIK